MSAAEALMAAGAAGIQLGIEGGDLVLTASVAPPSDVIDLLSRHKSEIVRLLRPDNADPGVTGRPRRFIWHGDRHPEPEAEHLIPRTGVGLLTGPSGCGKNFIALDLGRAIASRKPFFGTVLAAEGAAVFLLSHGKAHGFGTRTAALGEPDPLPLGGVRLDDVLGPRAICGALPADALDRIAETLANQRVRMQLFYDAPLRLAAIDSLELSGLLPRDESGAREFIARLGAVAEELGVFVLVVCQKPESGMDRRIWAAMATEADLVLEVQHRVRAVRRRLVLTAGAFAAPRLLGTFHLQTVTVGEDSSGRPITSCVVLAKQERRASSRFQVRMRRLGMWFDAGPPTAAR